MRERLSTSSSEGIEKIPLGNASEGHLLAAHRKKFPIAALAALALVAAFEFGYVWHNRYHFWDANYILLEKKREALTSQVRPDDVAILGSSRFYHLQPAAIAALVGKNAKVTNYAWAYCGIETYEAMLRGLIDSGRKPKIILADGFPEIFSYPAELLTITKSDELETGFIETAPFISAMETTVYNKNWKSAWDIFAYGITPPSILFRQRVKSCIKTLFSTGRMTPLPPDYENRVGDWERKGWFYYAPPEHVANAADFQALQKLTGPHIYRNNKSVANSYERFIRLAYDNDIRIILLPVPNNPVAFEAFNKTGVFKKYDNWLDRLEKTYDNFEAPGPRWFTWPGLLGDAGHVNAAGAKRHMELIADLLRGRLNK